MTGRAGQAFHHQQSYIALHRAMPAERKARSIAITLGGAKVETCEIVHPTPAEAMQHAVEHARFMVRTGAWFAGTYRFAEVGTDRNSEVRLAGPKRAG